MEKSEYVDKVNELKIKHSHLMGLMEEENIKLQKENEELKDRIKYLERKIEKLKKHETIESK